MVTSPTSTRRQGYSTAPFAMQHQMYNAGQFFEMAVEHARRSGRTKVLDASSWNRLGWELDGPKRNAPGTSYFTVVYTCGRYSELKSSEVLYQLYNWWAIADSNH